MTIREIYMVEGSVDYHGNAPSLVLRLDGENTAGKRATVKVCVDPCIVEAIVSELRKTTKTIADRWRQVEAALGRAA
jgi:hypothetical protein